MDAGPVAEETEGVPVGGDELLKRTAAKPSSQLSGDSPTATDAGGLHGHNKASGCLARPIDRDVLLALQEAVLAVSSDGTVVLFNSAAASLWGWQAEEVTGQPVHILLGEGTDLARARHQRLRTKHKAGHELFLRVSVSDVLLAVGVGEAPEAVRRVIAEDMAEDPDYLQLNAIVDLATFPVVACSRAGEVIKFNKAASQVFRISQADAQGRDILELFAAGSALTAGRPAAEVLETFVGSASGKEERGARFDGSTFPMRVSVSKVETKDRYMFTLLLEDITRELADKESLKAEQRKTAAIMNSALNAIITTDNSGAIELINTSACRIFGVEQENAGNLASLLLLENGSHPPEESMGEYLHEAAGTVRELVGRRTDGSTFPMRMSVSEVDSEGKHLFTAILRDVTEEKENQALVAAEQRKTAAIMNSALNAIITTDSQGRFELVNTSACRIFGLAQGQTDGKSMSSLIVLEDGSHPPEDSMGSYLHSAAGTVRELEGRRGDGSIFPMRMSVSEVNSEGQHLFTAILRDITKEKLDKSRVEQEQRKTAAIMNSALNAIITTDRDGYFELINTSALQIFGLAEGKTEGQNIASLLLLDDGSQPSLDGVFEYLHGAAGTVRELQGRRADGSTFPMRMSISEVRSDGQHLFTAILRDITKERQHQAAVDREQRKTAAIMNSALNAIITTDNHGTFELINTSACRIFGLTQGQTEGQNIASLLLLDDGSPPTLDGMEEFLHAASGTVRELQGRRTDGSTFPMRMSISEVNSDGQHLFTAILRDITKEKEHDARVHAEQRKTAAIMNSALNAIITTDNSGAIELINTSACRIFGVEQKNAGNLSSLLLLEDGSHPPEDSMGKYLHEAAGTVRELEGCRADGSTFPMRMSVSEVNSEGQHLFTAILRDVTKEKEDQARLNAANQTIKLEKSKLQALLDSTVEGFIVVNSVGLIESFNKSAIKIFGYEAEEAVGRNVSMLMAGKHARRHDKYLRKYLKKGKGAAVVGHAREVTAMRKNGTEFQILLSISETVVNGDHYFTATVRDLSNELLLLNMLPMSIAARLKANEGPIHDGHENVSILFADICGFTSLSSTLTPFEVVSFLNDIFHDFDELADRYRLEKIKTIGDCYMVVSGLPEACVHHALKLACFAIEMREALLRYNERSNLAQPLSMRIGMHCGPVIAGVVGKRKFLYDIWGDAVNVASRMESTGKPGEIHLSNDIKERLEDWFELEDRGMTTVKGKGDMHTWILKNPAEHAEQLLLHQLIDTLSIADTTSSISTSAWSIADPEEGPKLGPVFRSLQRKHWPEDTFDSTIGVTTASRVSFESDCTEMEKSREAIALSFSRQREQDSAQATTATEGARGEKVSFTDNHHESNPPLPGKTPSALPTVSELASYREGLCNYTVPAVRGDDFRGDSVDALLPRVSSYKPAKEPQLKPTSEEVEEEKEIITLPTIPVRKQRSGVWRGSKVAAQVHSIGCWDRVGSGAGESSSRGCSIM